MLTSSRKVRGTDEINNETNVGDTRSNRGAECHPEGFAVRETIVETMFNSEHGDGDYIDDICRVM